MKWTVKVFQLTIKRKTHRIECSTALKSIYMIDGHKMKEALFRYLELTIYDIVNGGIGF